MTEHGTGTLKGRLVPGCQRRIGQTGGVTGCRRVGATAGQGRCATEDDEALVVGTTVADRPGHRRDTGLQGVVPGEQGNDSAHGQALAVAGSRPSSMARTVSPFFSAHNVPATLSDAALNRSMSRASRACS